MLSSFHPSEEHFRQALPSIGFDFFSLDVDYFAEVASPHQFMEFQAISHLSEFRLLVGGPMFYVVMPIARR
jgi:hypothetical protein